MSRFEQIVQFIRAMGLTGTILLMLGVVLLGQGIVAIVERTHPLRYTDVGVHAGTDVTPTGTNAWQ